MRFVLILFCCMFSLVSCDQRFGVLRDSSRKDSCSVATKVVSVESRTQPLYSSGPGIVVASNTVLVKSRADGEIVRIGFKEGQEVRKGDLLFVVDQRPYRLALAQTQANLAKDEALLQDAEASLERSRALLKADIIAKQQLDSQRATVAQLEAAVRADSVQVQASELNLEYTETRSPVDGRVGFKMVDVGNIVHASDSNPLVVISQLQPIFVVFELPQDSIAAVRAGIRQGGELSVQVDAGDGAPKAAKLLTIDNQIDQATGTAKFKAVLDNRERGLWPNQAVNVTVFHGVVREITIPVMAIHQGEHPFVYVLKKNNAVEVRMVNVVLTRGDTAVISDGLKQGDLLVITCGNVKLASPNL